MGSSLESKHQEQATRKTVEDKHAFLVTLDMRGCVGELEWVIKLSATFVKQRSAQNMQVKRGKNLFCRGVVHVADAQRRAADKPLWKHILDKHEGRLEISIFDHFSMSRTGVFVKPQRRKANEGVRISHLNPDTRMNSKDEFRQGTNITMRPVRGVGE